MLPLLHTIGWLACVVYSTIPSFWMLIHPRAEYWRSLLSSPFKILLPLWIGMWAIAAALTDPWRRLVLYQQPWLWCPAAVLLCAGCVLYKLSGEGFTLSQLGGLPELRPNHPEQNLVTTGVRARVRHPIYLGHLCEMLAWSIGTGLIVCWALTGFAIITGAIMIQMEDNELEKRFGREYLDYRERTRAVVPWLRL